MPRAFLSRITPWKAALVNAMPGLVSIPRLLVVALGRLIPAIPPTALIALLMALPLAAPAAARSSEIAAEIATPRLEAAGGGARLELPSGETVELALPPGAALETTRALAGGWIAAGTAATDGGTARDLLLLTGGALRLSSPESRFTAGGSCAACRDRREPRPLGGPAGVAQLPPPGGRTGRLRAEPLPLVEDGSLAGLIWLEGDDPRSLAVRYASWNGAAWDEPRLISPAGRGSQLALTAARLADGSWLLAWSAFDGHDDEIVWSRGSAGAWTRPQRLTDNQVPDITPALAAAGRGALVAWSQLAGDGYRLLVARFGDGRWSEPAAVAPGGSLYPSFEPSSEAGRLRLRFRTARPRGWAAIELDTAGRPLRRAEWPDGGAERAASWSPWQAPAPPPAAASGWTASAPGRGGSNGPRRQPRASGEAAGREPSQPGGTATTRAAAASSEPVYVAFGDSITAGFGDAAGLGYPGRLEPLLSAALKTSVTVVNAGFLGETTAEGLSRIDSVLQPGDAAVLLMEGTNDVNARVSVDTIVQNLDLMAGKAEALGVKAVHATIIPRLPTAASDSSNLTTGTLAGGIRELAWKKSRTLADPFEVFFYLTPDALTSDYLGGSDALHPNAAGYDLIAHTFADVLTGVDKVPPVTGNLSPFNGQQNVSPNAEIQMDVYDFGAGIDMANTHLLINGQAVGATPAGDQRKLEFRYQPPAPLAGVVTMGLQTQDLAQPPNVFNGTLATFVIAGTIFLPGDINHDGVVDGLDLILFAPCFGAHRFNSNFRLYCDFNGDGIVDGADLAILAFNFGHRTF
jgi:acyl-CoA thioesterase-1